MKKLTLLTSLSVGMFLLACDETLEQPLPVISNALAQRNHSCGVANRCDANLVCCSDLREWYRGEGTCRFAQDCDLEWLRDGEKVPRGGTGATFTYECPAGTVEGAWCATPSLQHMGRCLYDDSNKMYCEFNCHKDAPDESPAGVSCSKATGGFANPLKREAGFCNGQGTCQLCESYLCRPMLASSNE